MKIKLHRANGAAMSVPFEVPLTTSGQNIPQHTSKSLAMPLYSAGGQLEEEEHKMTISKKNRSRDSRDERAKNEPIRYQKDGQ